MRMRKGTWSIHLVAMVVLILIIVVILGIMVASGARTTTEKTEASTEKSICRTICYTDYPIECGKKEPKCQCLINCDKGIVPAVKTTSYTEGTTLSVKQDATTGKITGEVRQDTWTEQGTCDTCYESVSGLVPASSWKLAGEVRAADPKARATLCRVGGGAPTTSDKTDVRSAPPQICRAFIKFAFPESTFPTTVFPDYGDTYGGLKVLKAELVMDFDETCGGWFEPTRTYDVYTIGSQYEAWLSSGAGLSWNPDPSKVASTSEIGKRGKKEIVWDVTNVIETSNFFHLKDIFKTGFMIRDANEASGDAWACLKNPKLEFTYNYYTSKGELISRGFTAKDTEGNILNNVRWTKVTVDAEIPEKTSMKVQLLGETSETEYFTYPYCWSRYSRKWDNPVDIENKCDNKPYLQYRVFLYPVEGGSTETPILNSIKIDFEAGAA